VSADSLKALQKFAHASDPIVAIDGTRSDADAFGKLSTADIASIEVLKATDKDIEFYGPKAKNGIIRVTTKPKGQTNAKGSVSGNGTARIQIQGGQIQMKSN
jgi:hypothetical protein